MYIYVCICMYICMYIHEDSFFDAIEINQPMLISPIMSAFGVYVPSAILFGGRISVSNSS